MDQRDREVLLEIKSDLKETKTVVASVKEQQAIDHFILKEHESRSTQLEGRVAPLEEDVKFVRRLIAFVVGLVGLWESVRLFVHK